MKNPKYGKKARLVNLTAATALIVIILASSFFYGGSGITGNAASEKPPNFIAPSIKEINFNGLRQLNEGWYQIRNGYVFYMETFDSYVPLYIKVNNPHRLNGLLVGGWLRPCCSGHGNRLRLGLNGRGFGIVWRVLFCR